jgi:hypothetical protein
VLGVPRGSLAAYGAALHPRRDEAGSCRGMRDRKHATAVLPFSNFRSPERNASASWLHSRTSAPRVLESMKLALN